MNSISTILANILLSSAKAQFKKVNDVNEKLKRTISTMVKGHGYDPDSHDVEAWSAKVVKFLNDFTTAVDAHQKKEEMKVASYCL